jgi:hypothetical protein|nr:MAG TPA: Protein of unknown function (DUF4257) [Caudoviricetes sp.]
MKANNKKKEMRLNETKLYVYAGMITAVLMIATKHPTLAVMMILWAIVMGVIGE